MSVLPAGWHWIRKWTEDGERPFKGQHGSLCSWILFSTIDISEASSEAGAAEGMRGVGTRAASDGIGSGGVYIRVQIKSSSEEQVLVNLLPWAASLPSQTSVCTSAKWVNNACVRRLLSGLTLGTRRAPSIFNCSLLFSRTGRAQESSHCRCSRGPWPAECMKKK